MNKDDPSRVSLLRDVTGSGSRNTSRRSVLGGVVAGVGAALGLSTPAAGDDTDRGYRGALGDAVARSRYGSSGAFERALARHDEMLERLAVRGLLPGASADALVLDPGDRSRDGALETVSVVETAAGTATPELRLSRRLDDGRRVTVAVRPETGERWAAVGGRDPTVLGDVTATGCCQCCDGEFFCCEFDGDQCVEFCTRCDCSEPDCSCP